MRVRCGKHTCSICLSRELYCINVSPWFSESISSKLMLTFFVFIDKEDDARLIYMEMYGLRTKYHIIGTCLGISPDKLEEIRCRFPETQANHAANALSEMLLAWLRQSNTSGPFGAPSWKAVVKVVAHDAGGGNVLLAREIAKNHRKKLG